MNHFIRRGEFDDIDWVLRELREFSEFYGTGRELYPGDEQARMQLKELMENHVFFISDRQGERMGFISGILAPHFFNPEIIVLTEILWWVPVRHRGTSAGYRLLKEFTKTGKRIADWTIMTIECKSKVSDSTILSMGYTQYEKSFLLEV